MPNLVTEDGTQLDPQVVKLMRGIRTVESGGNYDAVGKSGEFGAFQFLPDTYRQAAPQYGIDPADTSRAAQNKVAYSMLKSYKDRGFSPEQAAAAWNAGEGSLKNDAWRTNVGVNSKGVSFDTPGYVQKVIAAAKGMQEPTMYIQPQEQAPSIGGFAKNVVTSGANFIGNTADALLHPIKTIQNVGGALAGGLQELGGQQNENTAKFDSLVNFFKERYGSVQSLEHTIYTDPVGFAADLSAVLGGAAAVAGKAGTLAGVADASRASSLALDTGLRTMAKDTAVGNLATRTGTELGKAAEVVNPLSAVGAGVSRIAKSDTATGMAETIASKITGLEPTTIRQIIASPRDFTADAISSASRKSLADEIASEIASKQSDLSELGKAYSPIRKAETPIGVSPSFLTNQIEAAAGVSVQDGRVVASASSKVRDARDIRALQQLHDTFQPAFSRGAITTNEFLNLRTDLAKLAKFERDVGKSSELETIAEEIRRNLNAKYRQRIPGLENLDSSFSPQIETLKQLKAGLFKRNGEPVANFTNKIARAIGTGKDDLLAQLEQIVPGITGRIKVQAAIEDIQKAAGNKVGLYTKSGIEAGGALLGAATGNIHILAGALATAIIASPEIAVPLLRVFGFKSEIVSGVLGNLAKYVNSGTVLNKATQTGSSTPIPQETIAQSPQIETSFDASTQ